MTERPSDEQLNQSLEAAKRTRRPPAAAPPRPPPGPVDLSRPPLPQTAVRPAAHQVAVADAFTYDVAFRLAFLGTGQAGSRLVDAFYQLGYRRAAVFNTTDMDFGGIDEDLPRLNLGVGGAAKDPLFAKNSLRGRDEEVWDLMTRAWGNDPDYALVCAGLGGGTGSGTVGPLVETARRYLVGKGRPPRVGAVISLPTVAEGQQQARNAVAAFKTLLALKASPLLIVDNARIHELYHGPGFSQLYPLANSAVSRLLHLFNAYAAVHSPLVTFDRSELGQLLDGGIVVMGAAEIPVPAIKSPADVSSRIRDELAKTVLASCDLRRGKKAACLFVGAAEVLDQFSLDFFDAGFTQLDRMVGSAYGESVATVIHRGVYVGAGDGLQCYTMISELEPPVERLAELARKARLDQYGSPEGLAAFLKVQD